MLTVPNGYLFEFRSDVVQFFRNREPGVTLEKIAAYLGIHPITLPTWLKKAGIGDGMKPTFRSSPFEWCNGSLLSCVGGVRR